MPDWHGAFLEQGRSDLRVFHLLEGSGSVEFCHSLRYLQSTAEKLAKAHLAAANPSTPPPAVHAVIVYLIQHLRADVSLQAALGIKSRGQFVRYTASLLPIAALLEEVAPSGSMLQANCEYPWMLRNGDVVAPCRHDFAQLMPTLPAVSRFCQFLERFEQHLSSRR